MTYPYIHTGNRQLPYNYIQCKQKNKDTKGLFRGRKSKDREDTKVFFYQNPYIEEEQTTQCPKEKVQRDKQQSTKHL